MTSASMPSESEITCALKMMERLGLESGNAAVPRWSLRYATIFRRCGSCQAKHICLQWLERSPTKLGSAPRFCPNADTFFELLFDQPGPHPSEDVTSS